MEIHPAITIFVFGALLIFLLWGLSLASKSKQWLTTSGALTISGIDEFRGRIRVVGKKLLYSYLVNGEEYTGSRVYAPITENLFVYIIWFNSSKYIDRNYKDGQSVDISFDQKNPSRSCLRPGGEVYVWAEFGIWSGILFFLYILTNLG